MNSCPCCNRALLRHIRRGQICWFCTSCWQEMPNLDSLQIYIHHCHLKHEQIYLNQNAARQLSEAPVSKEVLASGCSGEDRGFKPKKLELAGRS